MLSPRSHKVCCHAKYSITPSLLSRILRFDAESVVTGLSLQGYANPLFWERLALAVAPLVPSLGPESAAALLLHAPPSPPACAELAAAAAQRLRGHLPQLSRTTAVNVAHHLNRIHTLSHRLPAASTALGAAIPPLAAELSEVAASEGYLDALPAKQAALLISALDRLGAPRAASSPAGDAAVGGEAEAETANDTLRAAATAATAAADPTAAVGGLSPAVCEAVGRWVTLRVPLTPPPPTPTILAPTFPAASLALALRSSVGASSRLQLRHVAGIASALAASGYRNDEVYSRLAFYCLVSWAWGGAWSTGLCLSVQLLGKPFDQVVVRWLMALLVEHLPTLKGLCSRLAFFCLVSEEWGGAWSTRLCLNVR